MFNRFKAIVWAGTALGALALALPATAQDRGNRHSPERAERPERVERAERPARVERQERAGPVRESRPSGEAWRARGNDGEARAFRGRGDNARGVAASGGVTASMPAPAQVRAEAAARGNGNGYVSAPRDRSYGAYSRNTGQASTAARNEAAAAASTRWAGGNDRRDGDRSRSESWRGNDRRDGDRNRSEGWRSNDRRDGDRDRNDGWRANDRREEARRDERRDDARNYARGYRDGYRSDNRYGSNHRQWDRSRWRNDNRYDWYRYRAANRSIFSLGRYYAPYRDYRYSRVSIGFRLGSLFYSNRYWISDPWRYRLPDVYGPYRWVRYYDDALLVDVYSGQVVDVIYDFFW